MAKYGPTRGEWRFRLIVSLCGLALMIGALLFRGVPTGPAFVEVVLIAGGFFGGSAVWSGWRLWQGRTPPTSGR